MGFFNLILLLGLAVVAIPPIIHLLNRRRYEVVDWGAMQFLQISEVTRRRLMIEELLLTPGGCLNGLVDRRVFAGIIRAWLDGDDAATRPHIVWRCLNAALWLEDLKRQF